VFLKDYEASAWSPTATLRCRTRSPRRSCSAPAPRCWCSRSWPSVSWRRTSG
jgi:hypothetical protein